ncbi:hypothetical protein [Streptomyces purpureus]
MNDVVGTVIDDTAQAGNGGAARAMSEDSAGTALLLAAAPAGKGRVIDAASALPALAAVPPSALTGTGAATVVELADPLDPQTVLTRLRAAAAAPGPLSVYIAGQLHLDRRQGLPHLALARTATATLRYTALPWHWLAGELKIRRPGTTRVVVDLVADAEVWERWAGHGTLLSLGQGTSLYGRVAPPPPRRTVVLPAYLKAYASIWRSGARPPLPLLHEQAAARAGAEDGAVLLATDGTAPTPWPSGAMTGMAPPAGPSAPLTTSATPPPAGPVAAAAPAVAAPAPDPHPAILAAAQAGRHAEAAAAAAAWEQDALRLHGPRSPQAIHWMEVRADLARLAQDPARSCELWLVAARARLDAGGSPADRDVEGAVDRAHHQWERLTDPARAQALAPALVALRERVPGRQPGAVEALRRRLG